MRPEGAVRGDHARRRAEKRLPRAARPSCEQHRGYAVADVRRPAGVCRYGLPYRDGDRNSGRGIGSGLRADVRGSSEPVAVGCAARAGRAAATARVRRRGGCRRRRCGHRRHRDGVLPPALDDRRRDAARARSSARGASGYNAGQLTTYFERPLSDIADEFGWELAAEAQRDVEEANGLLDTMVAEAGASVRVERFTGQLGMFNRHHLEVHLRCLLVRKRAGLPPHECLVSEDAGFLGELSPEFAGLYSVVPQARVRELLEVEDDRYCAVLSEPAGCSNSALLCQQVLGHLQRTLWRSVRVRGSHQRRAGGGRRRSRGGLRRCPSSRSRPRGAVHEWVCRPCRRGRRRLADPALRRPADHRPDRAHDRVRETRQDPPRR